MKFTSLDTQFGGQSFSAGVSWFSPLLSLSQPHAAETNSTWSKISLSAFQFRSPVQELIFRGVKCQGLRILAIVLIGVNIIVKNPTKHHNEASEFQKHCLQSKISKVLPISAGENGKFPSQPQHLLKFWEISANTAEQRYALMIWLFHCLLWC